MPLLLYNVVDNEAHFTLECLLYNSTRDKFQSYLKGSIRESQVFISIGLVKISLFLMEATALCCSNEIASLIPS
jgi:hypothetical protein